MHRVLAAVRGALAFEVEVIAVPRLAFGVLEWFAGERLLDLLEGHINSCEKEVIPADMTECRFHAQRRKMRKDCVVLERKCFLKSSTSLSSRPTRLEYAEIAA